MPRLRSFIRCKESSVVYADDVIRCSITCAIFFFAVVYVTRPLSADDSLWSLAPLVKPAIPTDVGEWKNPIDAFVARKHKENQIQPVGRANELALLRRVTLDLVGLPPTLEEQQEFHNGDFETSYAAAVERLLDSHSMESAMGVIGLTSCDTQISTKACRLEVIYIYGEIG